MQDLIHPGDAGHIEIARKVVNKMKSLVRATMIRTDTHKLIYRPQGVSELYDMVGLETGASPIPFVAMMGCAG